MAEGSTTPSGTRAHWGSRLGFILAAAGSAVGLGNIWRFPYVTGENGGGLFVITYLICIAVVGLPVMMAEIFIGRTAQNSPVGAFRSLSKSKSPWMGVGWLGVVAAFVILSFYSVVAGWAMHYAWVSLTETFAGKSAEEIQNMFGTVSGDPALCSMWHLIFMAITISIVVAGVQQGIELWVRILMPVLFILLLVLLVYSIVEGNFVQGLEFIFKPNPQEFAWTSIIEALGQAFFTLSLGMGAMLTYGSYLQRDDDLVTTSLSVTVIDTSVAILGAMVLFPILFSAGLESDQSVGLAFISLPIAFSEMPGGTLLAPAFFILLTFAALTSSISLLEVATAYFIDEVGWSRTKASLATGGAIMLIGIPSAISYGSELFGEGMKTLTAPIFGEQDAKTWLDLFDYLSSNWILPLGGLGIALFVAWRVPSDIRERGFKVGTKFAVLYWGWVQLLRYVVPIGVVLVFFKAIGVFNWLTQ